MNLISRIARMLLALSIAAVVLLANTGCNTAHGFGKDVEKVGEKIKDGTQ